MLPITPFRLWEPPTWVIPKFYWDAMSQEQRIHAICKTLEKVITYADYLGENVDDLREFYEQLAQDFEAFKEHGFDDYYAAQVEQWIADNLEYVFNTFVRQVYFGLTLDGHFVAYIPESWDDIVFDTGMIYELDTYGRLILRWDADSPYNVEQTSEIVRPSGEYSDLVRHIENLMNSLYNPNSE